MLRFFSVAGRKVALLFREFDDVALSEQRGFCAHHAQYLRLSRYGWVELQLRSASCNISDIHCKGRLLNEEAVDPIKLARANDRLGFQKCGRIEVVKNFSSVRVLQAGDLKNLVLVVDHEATR